MEIINKKNIAAYKVLHILLYLFHNNLTMMELTKKLKKRFPGPCKTNLVLKYINTIKNCGVKIERIHDKFCLIEFPLTLEFTETDTDLLYELQGVSDKTHDEENGFSIARFFEKIHLPFFRSGVGLFSNPNYNIIKNFELAYKTNSEIITTDRDNKLEVCFVRGVRKIDGKCYYVTVNESGVKEVNPDDINKVVFLEKKRRKKFSVRSIMYQLTGKLAERYKPRENEHIIKEGDGTMTISNDYDDRRVLIQRLLRYDSSCKVLGPADFLIAFREVVANSLENYNINPERHSRKYMEQKLRGKYSGAKKPEQNNAENNVERIQQSEKVEEHIEEKVEEDE